MSNTKRTYFIMIGLVALLSIGFIAAVILGNSMLQKQSKKLTGLKLENRVLEEQQAALAQANKDIEKYSELEKIAKSIVPQDKDQAQAVRVLSNLAKDSGVSVKSILFPPSSLGQTSPKPTTSPESTGDTTAPASTSVTQVKPVEGIPGLFQMEITLQSFEDTVRFPQLISYLERLENNRRTAQITSLTIVPEPTDRSLLTVNVTISIFIKP